MAFRTAAEYLKIGEIASQLSFQRFMEFGYLGVHFSVTRSKSQSFLLISGLVNRFKSVANAFLSLSGTYFNVFRT